MNAIWAVARNVIIEFRKMRMLIFFLILLTLLYTAGLGLFLYTSAGPAQDKMQTFIGWSLRCAKHILALLTIFLAVATITRDIQRKEIYTIATKPISRLQFLVGKFLGLALLNFILLLISGGLIYTTTKMLASYAPETEGQRSYIKELILTARQAAPPQYEELEPGVLRKAVNDKIERLVQDQVRRDNMDDPVQINAMRQRLAKLHANNLEKSLITVEPGGQLNWNFRNIKPRDTQNGYLFIRFKTDVSNTPDNLKIVNQWQFGPKDPRVAGGEKFQNIDVIRTFSEFAVPVTQLSPEGDFYLTYFNPVFNRTNVIFPVEDGIQLLYVTGTFEENFLRSLFLVYGRLIFLSLLGVAIGAWLSFPVAVLSVLFTFILGVSSSFITDSTKWQTADLHADAVNAVMSLIPKFSLYDPVPELEIGRIVSTERIAQCILFLLIVKGTLVALVGYLIFRFRELARVIV